MAFSYNLETDVGQLRLEIGDEIEDTGIKPNGANFQDAELEYFLTTYAGDTDQVMKAAAYACEVLARQWSRQAGSLAVGSGEYSESFKQAEAFTARAKELRASFGGGGSLSLVAGTIRIPFQQELD
jgi:hypothetical protein